jgi:hypothetical protein
MGLRPRRSGRRTARNRSYAPDTATLRRDAGVVIFQALRDYRYLKTGAIPTRPRSLVGDRWRLCLPQLPDRCGVHEAASARAAQTRDATARRGGRSGWTGTTLITVESYLKARFLATTA